MTSAPLATSAPVVAALRLRAGALAVELAVSDQAGPVGEAMALSVDGAMILRPSRPALLSARGYTTAMTPVADPAPLLERLRSGQSAQFTTGALVAAVPLDGAAQAITALLACDTAPEPDWERTAAIPALRRLDAPEYGETVTNTL